MVHTTVTTTHHTAAPLTSCASQESKIIRCKPDAREVTAYLPPGRTITQCDVKKTRSNAVSVTVTAAHIRSALRTMRAIHRRGESNLKSHTNGYKQIQTSTKHWMHNSGSSTHVSAVFSLDLEAHAIALALTTALQCPHHTESCVTEAETMQRYVLTFCRRRVQRMMQEKPVSAGVITKQTNVTRISIHLPSRSPAVTCARQQSMNTTGGQSAHQSLTLHSPECLFSSAAAAACAFTR